ncbi:MAG: NHLP bacteriocin export ABC transporter permease/ATPase subunit [Pseudomonadota bacterium]
MTEEHTESAPRRPPQRVELRGHQPFLLNEPESAWLVQSGGVDVVATRIEHNEPTTFRRHLFQAGERQLLFGWGTSEDTDYMGVMCVSTGATRFTRYPLEEIDAIIARGDAGGQQLVAGWVEKVGTALATGTQRPTDIVRLDRDEGDELLDVSGGSNIGGHKYDCMWMRVVSGMLTGYGVMGNFLMPEDGYVLVAPEMWFTAVGDGASVEFMPLDSGCPEGATASAALATLHRLVALNLMSDRQFEELEELKRREESEQLGQLRAQSAYQQLASVLSPDEIFERRETDLITTAGVVGTVMGIRIEPPAASEDMSRVSHPIEAIARASRVRYRMILLGLDWWKDDMGPLIGYLSEPENKPVALLPRNGRYDIVDPETCKREPLTDEIKERISPEAYMFYGGLTSHASKLMDLLRFTARGRLGDVAFVLGAGIAATLLGLITPRVTGTLVDTAIPFSDKQLVWELFALLFVAALATGVFTFAQLMATVRSGIKSEVAAQSAMWDRLLKFRPEFFRVYSAGDMQTRVNAVSEVARELSSATLRPMITGVLALLNFLLLWYYSWDLAKIALWIGLAVLIVTFVASFLVRRLSIPLHDLEGDFNGLMIQLIGGVGKLRVAGAEYRAFNHWVSKYTEQLRFKLRIQLIKDVVNVFNGALPPLASAVLFWQAVDLTIGLPIGDEDRITVGDFIAFNTAFVLYIAGWQDVSNTLVGVLDSLVKGKRIQPLIEGEPEVPDDASDPGRLKGGIKLENVSFRYHEGGPLILDRVSFEVKPGEYVAFVGSSGSGKSTIQRILLGFETPEYGRVLFDGQDLSGLDVLAVRRQIGTVLQNGRLNAGSILDNLANNANITHGEAWDAAADAGMSDDINDMPMGLHTVVSEGGSNLSGGQRQRLLIGRALATRPKIVMFDEATSALDNKTQAIVSEALDRRRVTRRVIAHRLSTIRFADRIYVLDGGKLVQQGSFEELAAEDGLFRDLMQRQMA